MLASPGADLQLEVVEVVFANVALAALNQQDAGRWELRSETARDNAAGSAASHDNIVEGGLVASQSLDGGHCDFTRDRRERNGLRVDKF